MPAEQPSSLPKQLLALSILACVLSFGCTYYLSHQVEKRNLTRIAAVESYTLGLDQAARAANSTYPLTGEGFFCLNKNPNSKCWNLAHENATPLEVALAPVMLGRPNPDPTNIAFDGILYESEDDGAGYALLWFLEGAHAACDPGFVLAADYGGTGNTLCELYR